MTTTSIAPATPADLPALAAVGARAQADRERFVAYVGETPDTISAELADVAGWAANTVVAHRDGEIVGWLTAETDDELHRVWWWGPIVDPAAGWAEVADPLYGAARERLDAHFDQEELAADASSETFRAFAGRHGFHSEEASTVLRIDIGATWAHPRIVEATDADRDELAALHDAVFPSTHMTGRQLAVADGVRLVVRDGADLVGYVAVELQAGDEGYIDFLGVDPDHRRRGLGRALVATALDELRRRGVTSAHLTVRAGSAGARALYRSLGFTEVRDLCPYRKGFRLP